MSPLVGVGAGPRTWRKTRRNAPPGFFATEAAGLRWLTVPGGPRVAEVIDVGADYLELELVSTDLGGRANAPASTDSGGRADRAEAAWRFGTELATMHDAGASGWGVLPPGASAGYFGPLDDPLPMASGSWPDWPTFYAEARLAPILAQGRQRRVFDGGDATLFAQVSARLPELIGAAGDNVPARLHGDLWSGNVLWSPRRQTGGVTRGDQIQAVLIDPAAQGGHRECDLAMLALFGAPYLDRIIAGYEDQHPLAVGWQGRIGLHQLYPLAVHAVLFGGGYINQTRALLRELASAV